MSTIFEPLSESITNQIKIRQDIMANKVTNPTVRNAYLNRACKVRLVPLVKDTKGDTDYNDFVFGNFTLEDNFFNSLGFKFSDKAEKPYINNFEIVTRSGDNYGATRTGKISIVVPTKKQFNLIERYFRIGVPFLLEWGWAEHVKYEGNNPTKETTEFIDPKLYEGDKISGKKLEEAVFDNKETQNGNYDGGLFFITNFTTNIQNNGVDYYYVLDINVITRGDILNSLEPNKTTNPNASTSIEDKINSDPIIQILKRLNQQNISDIQDESESSFDPETNNLFKEIISPISNNYISNNYISLPPQINRPKPEVGFFRGTETLTLDGIPSQQFLQQTNIKNYSYIKLGYFLELLFIFGVDKVDDLVYIEGDFEYKLPLYYYTLPPESKDYYKWNWDPEKHFASIDPRKFLLPHYKWGKYFGEEFISKDDNKKIKNILLETTFLIDELSNLIRKNEYSINNILALILNTINRYTDNDIRLIKYDISDFAYSIVSVVDGDDFNTNDLLTLKLYGTGSIAEETNIDTVINDKISSQIAIMMNGSSDYVTDSQAISLLKFNNGIQSRLKSELPDKGDGRVDLQSILETIEAEFGRYHSILTFDPNSKYIKDGPQFDILKLYKRFKQEYTAAIIEYSKLDSIKGTPLFPIKIKTRLPGISGIKIGNKLKIDDVRLPDIYTDRNIYYVVTNYNSTVNNRYWESYIDLSPQINTQFEQLSKSEIDTKGLIATRADIEKVLDAIKLIETGNYYFKGNKGPEWVVGNSEPSNVSGLGDRIIDPYKKSPLYADGLFIDEKTARRGPFQLTPLQYFEAQTANNDVIEYDFNSGVGPDARYLWKNPKSFNSSIDTIVESRKIAKKYIEKLSEEIPSEQRTYLRLLSIHYLGRNAIAEENLKQFTDLRFLPSQRFLEFLINGKRVLINNLGVENKDLTDNYLINNIGIDI
jgi:hypothetical protein